MKIEHHPTAYAPGEVRDDMSVPMAAIRRQPPAGRVGCSAFPKRILLPLFVKRILLALSFLLTEKSVWKKVMKKPPSAKTITNVVDNREIVLKED